MFFLSCGHCLDFTSIPLCEGEEEEEEEEECLAFLRSERNSACKIIRIIIKLVLQTQGISLNPG